MDEIFAVEDPMGAKEVIAGWSEVNNPLRFIFNRRVKSAELIVKIGKIRLSIRYRLMTL